MEKQEIEHALEISKQAAPRGSVAIAHKLRLLLEYYTSTRAVGHTSVMFAGAREADDIFILGYNYDGANLLARECKDAHPLGWAGLCEKNLRGHRRPLLIDNGAMVAMLEECLMVLGDTWIPVDEELPEAGRYVIGAAPVDDECWCVQSGRFRSPEDHNGLAVIETGSGGWQWISHWMPLPSPPAGL